MKNVISIQSGIYKQMHRALDDIEKGVSKFQKSIKELEQEEEDEEFGKVCQWRPKRNK